MTTGKYLEAVFTILGGVALIVTPRLTLGDTPGALTATGSAAVWVASIGGLVIILIGFWQLAMAMLEP